jgi:WASH complex subunit strumpellin
VRSDPRAVLKLRCVFLKLRSGLELPLLRAAQAGDAAAAPLQRYYSAALLAYVRKVLEVRPAPQFRLLPLMPY